MGSQLQTCGREGEAIVGLWRHSPRWLAKKASFSEYVLPGMRRWEYMALSFNAVSDGRSLASRCWFPSAYNLTFVIAYRR